MSTAFSAAARKPRHSGTPCAVIQIHLRLSIPDEDSVRYVFNEWERDCGVKSNQEAQINALQDRNFREVVESVASHHRRLGEGTERVRASERHLAQPRTPRSERGWSTLTAKPGKAPAQAVRVDVHFSPEVWTLRYEGKGGRGQQHRVRTMATFRTLTHMSSSGADRHVVVLWKLYGPTCPASDYVAFDRIAPIAHMTATAHDLAARATKALRREIAETHAGAFPARLDRIAAERWAIFERATALRGDPNRVRGDQVEALEGRLDELDGLERVAAGDIPAWTASRAEAERAVVEPREALRQALQKLRGAERDALIAAVRADAERLTRRAATAFYRARADREAA